LPLGRGPVIAAVAFFSGAGDESQHSLAIHFQHPLAPSHLDNVHIAKEVEVDAEGCLQPTAGGRTREIVASSGNHNGSFGVKRWSQQREYQRDERELSMKAHRDSGAR